MQKTDCPQQFVHPHHIGLCSAMRTERIGNIYGPQFGTGYAGNIWDKRGISPSLMTMVGGCREPMIVEVYEN